MEAVERRYERLPAGALDRLQAASPIAWVPVGTLEHHGPHLPTGVDGFEAHGLLLAAAALAGGAVLPPTYLAAGCLDLPQTLTFSHALVEAWARETVRELARRGWRVIVLLTGHGPLDLIHLLKRVAAEEAAAAAIAVYALCWLELNAAALAGPERGAPTVVDHASTIETSWMLALQPGLVQVEELPDDPAARSVGVYGANPRFTASAELGRSQIERGARLLADRATLLAKGGAVPPLGDLERFVELAWHEPLEVVAGPRAGTLGLRNPAPASRYLSAIGRLAIGGRAIDPAAVELLNASPGETARPVRADALGPEAGIYVRAGQVLQLDAGPLAPGAHAVELELELGGVRRTSLRGSVVVV